LSGKDEGFVVGVRSKDLPEPPRPKKGFIAKFSEGASGFRDGIARGAKDVSKVLGGSVGKDDFGKKFDKLLGKDDVGVGLDDDDAKLLGKLKGVL
jgi:hypothetical protein